MSEVILDTLKGVWDELEKHSPGSEVWVSFIDRAVTALLAAEITGRDPDWAAPPLSSPRLEAIQLSARFAAIGEPPSISVARAEAFLDFLTNGESLSPQQHTDTAK